MRRLWRVVAVVAPVAVLAVAVAVIVVVLSQRASGPGRPLALPPAERLPTSPTSHVVVLVMENKEYADVLGGSQSPYLRALARRSAIATRYYAIRHPSLPNYLALTGGSTFGVGSDCTDCHVGARNLVDQLEAAHRSWRAYMEGMPQPCFRGASAGGYAKKHDPFLYYDDVARSAARCRNVVPFTRLGDDLRRGALPAFAWISPNLCDDTHDCGVDAGDRFLSQLVPPLLHELGPRGFLAITWDEGTSNGGCCGFAHGGRVLALLAGPGVRPGARLRAPTDHYGLLRTVEDALGLPRLRHARCPCSGSLEPLLRPR